MKKKCLWSMLTIMMVAMLSVSMSSCSKDDSDSKKTGPFAGTVWAESASKTSEQLLFYHTAVIFLNAELQERAFA